MSKLTKVIQNRVATVDDLPFIADTLSHALHTRRDLIHLWLVNSLTNIVVACSINDNSQIIGFLFHNTDELALHFAYTKLPFRKLGVMNYLINITNANYKFYTLNCTRPDYLVNKYKMKYKPVLIIADFVNSCKR